jgi:para-nitrobenzyl esterase
MTMIAQTELGALRGAPEGGVIAFRGVPYADAARFAPPVEVAPWTGIRAATQDGPIAPQAPSRLRDAMGDFSRPQAEYCLTLTIWTPAADAARRPVLVWLHGGAWSSGAGSLPWYDGGVLAREQDIVVVGVNYRLGALGYLHLPGISPGNLGTMDQLAALRWVRDHIAGFGGDPDRVTVGGQSAGAASIGRMIADPAARALFRGAILQSGGFGRAPLSRDDAAQIGRAYVHLLDADPREASVADLIAAQGALARARARFAETTPPFMPLVEAPMTEAALLGAIAAGAGELNVLIGTTREEVHAFYAANPAMANPPEAAAHARFAGSLDAYRRRRPGGSLMDLLADLGTDHTFGWPSLRLADAIAAQGGRVHAYRFDWAPPHSKFKACHCIELPFTFGTFDAWPDAPMLEGGDAAQMEALSATLRAQWGRFVRDGAPGPSWPRYDENGRLTMLFGDVCGAVGDPSGLGWRA